MTPRLLVNIWVLGFLVCGIEQLSLQHYLGTNSVWGYSPWQTEIALWNFGIIGITLFLRRRMKDTDYAILPGFVFLSLILGTNHLITVIQNPTLWLHWAGMIANFGAIAITAVSWRIDFAGSRVARTSE
jgi:hypothetical protein